MSTTTLPTADELRDLASKALGRCGVDVAALKGDATLAHAGHRHRPAAARVVDARRRRPRRSRRRTRRSSRGG